MSRAKILPVPDCRIRSLNQAAPRPDGDFVLYWMTSSRRAQWNFALDRAVELARQWKRPLIVLEPLRTAYPWASDRMHRFVIDGMATNAKAFVFLGSIAGVNGRITEAEKFFQTAIKLDPTLTEPFYNLAVLRSREGKKKEALELYRRAIQNGAQPDLDFEQSLGE